MLFAVIKNSMSSISKFHLVDWALQEALVVKKLTANAALRDTGSIPGSGGSLEEGHGNPLQYSCLENPMDRGAWRATVHGVRKSQTLLSD